MEETNIQSIASDESKCTKSVEWSNHIIEITVAVIIAIIILNTLSEFGIIKFVIIKF